MITSHDFDTHYKHLADTMHSNNQAHKTRNVALIQATQEHDKGLKDAENNREATAKTSSEILGETNKQLDRGRKELRRVSLDETQVQVDGKLQSEDLPPVKGLNGAHGQAVQTLEALSSARRHLEDVWTEIERRKQRRRKLIQIALGLAAVSMLVIWISGDMRQHQADATATAVAYAATLVPAQTATELAIANMTATRVIAIANATATQEKGAILTATQRQAYTNATATQAPLSTATIVARAYTPVAHNANWTPVIRNFDGIGMVLVPVGCFMMGSNDGNSNEQPVKRQCFNTPFWIDRTEVTNRQYGSPSLWSSGDNIPRDYITWFEARDFCNKVGARLPTEAEWEYAARGPDSLIYPWGNEFIADNVVYGVNAFGQTADVGSRPSGASWVGALDLSGNVWEWTSSNYIRGGSADSAFDVRAATRIQVDPTNSPGTTGFRCIREY